MISISTFRYPQVHDLWNRRIGGDRLIYQFFVFAVDYTRTEYLQYEDDDYYYYVKAVPKLTVSAPDVKVQRIYSRKNVRHEKNETRE